MGSGIRKTACRWSWNAFVVVGLVVLACGRYPLGSTKIFVEPVLDSRSKKLTLAVFGAPSSSDAQSQISALQTELNKLSEAESAALDVVLYVPTGGSATAPPTQLLAEQYLGAVGLKGRAVADEWRWKNFRKYVGGAFNLPAAALVDLDDNVVKAFRAGRTSFVPAEIAASVRGSFPKRKEVTLALFGAPWCSSCKTEMPAIQGLLNALKPSERAFIDVVLYVTTAGNPNDAPTQELAEKYKEAVHLKGRALADEWRWKNFRKLVGGALNLPGAAVLDEGGNVLKSFRASATTFVPSEIVAFALKSTE